MGTSLSTANKVGAANNSTTPEKTEAAAAAKKGESAATAAEGAENVSAAHLANDAIALPLSQKIDKVPRNKKIGIGGSISAGKTTLGRAFQLACERINVPCHFAPETVNKEALQLYCAGQKLPDWFREAIEKDSSANNLLRYNRAFYDTTVLLANPHNVNLVARSSVPNVHANSFQILMLADCQHRVREAALFLALQKKNEGFAVVDRTAWDNTVFEEANRFLYRSISDDDHQFYELVRGAAPAFGVDALLYLDVSVDETLKRILVRGSSAEAKYQRVYMTYLHDIWFHRIVQNYTATPHYSLFDGSLKSGKEAPFPIIIVPWDDFRADSLQNVLQQLSAFAANPAQLALPRVFFEEKTQQSGAGGREGVEKAAEGGGGEGGGGGGRAVVMDWTADYASIADDAKRSEFKKRVIDLLARNQSIKFLF